jgi:hypothetical protein
MGWDGVRWNGVRWDGVRWNGAEGLGWDGTMGPVGVDKGLWWDSGAYIKDINLG